jgi:hypothetical protein
LLFSDLACCVSRKFWVIRVGMSSSVSLDMLAILMRFFFGAACFFSVDFNGWSRTKLTHFRYLHKKQAF